MKIIYKIFLLATVSALVFTACDKADKLLLYAPGTAPALSASATTVAPPPADSNKVALTFTWTDPKFATDSTNYKFVIEIDSAGKNFANPSSRTVMTGQSTSYLAKELNSILLARNYAFNVPVDMEVRLIASYANNNEKMISNIVKIKMTPYRIPPKVVPPAALYLVGDVNGWNNSASLDKQFYFYKTDETTFVGVFNFTTFGGYKLIQTLGNWDTQFRMLPGGNATAGQFEQKNADPAFPNPAPGSYRIVVDFQNGTYTATKTDAVRAPTPANLYLVGDVNGWNNSASLDPKYKFTKVDDFVFTINVDFTAGGGYKLIQTLGNWSTSFRRLSGEAFAGELEQRDANPSFPNPTPAGNYKITVNFATMTYSVVKN